MNRLMEWLFCDVDDTLRAALMLALAGAALNLTERASRRSGAHHQAKTQLARASTYRRLRSMQYPTVKRAVEARDLK